MKQSLFAGGLMREIKATDAKERAFESARDRIVRLYKFVAALYDRRNPSVRQMVDHEWLVRFAEVPEHSSVSLSRSVDTHSGEERTDDVQDVILSCKRPPRTPAPAKPEIIRDWLGREWDDCRTEAPKPFQTRNTGDSEGGSESFGDVPERLAAVREYLVRWSEWARNEQIALKVGELFERLYALHGKLQREGEKYELVLADGLLVWYRADGGVRHPVLLRPMRLEFDADAEIPEFRIVDAGTTEFYSSLFRSMEDVDGRSIGRLREEAEQLGLHPLGSSDTDGFLRALLMALSPRGQFAGESVIGPERSDPVIGRAACLLLRKRTSGVARAIDAIAEDAAAAPNFAQALCNVVGRPILEVVDSEEKTSISSPGPPSPIDANEDAQVLFTKPANAEQLEIARRLDLHDCVLVQGPPGTGKTHTIANLLGHLLARGKSVLVCSHTTKALKVLKEKVAPELQPLCVSVMDAPDDDQALKMSVEGIVARLSSADQAALERDVARLEAERNLLIKDAQETRLAILNARLDEQHPLIVGGDSTGVLNAAKEVAAGSGSQDWIPGPVHRGEPLPLTYNELADLYATSGQLTSDDEQALCHRLPEPAALPTPEHFSQLMEARAAFSECDLTFRRDLWDHDVAATADALDLAFETCADALSRLAEKPTWTRAIVADGAATDLEMHRWNALLEEIDRTYRMYLQTKECIILHAPQLSTSVSRDRAPVVYRQIADHVRITGKPPSFLTLLTRREWKEALEGATILNNVKPNLPDHFEALATLAQLGAQRDILQRRWRAEAVAVGGPEWDVDQRQVEMLSRRYSDLIRSSMEWHRNIWIGAQHRLYGVGLRWDILASEATAKYAELDLIDRLFRIVENELPSLFQAEKARQSLAEITRELGLAVGILNREGEGPIASNLRAAIESFDSGKYRGAFDELVRVRGISQLARTRSTLIGKLERVAPAWATAIRNRRDKHGMSHLPGDPAKAWRWIQFTQELDRREAKSLSELSEKLDCLRQATRRATAELADRKAWLAQLQRTTLEQRQALKGFAEAKRRIGRGTGKKAATLIRLAREQMSKARSAVPVWIMPIVKAAEVFDPRETKFDVVIVDEASQSDLTGLVVIYLGRQTIVVGDDEQVSPAAVGERISDSQHLIDEFLQGIPNADLFDGKRSLYDIASSSFGGDICLLEHFRCIPDIIRFSNALSYGGKIRPLREVTSSLPKPALVAHRVVAAGTMDGKINEVEARTVAALVAAAVEQPEYKDMTFGVISMVGDEQAYRIEAILRGLLPPKEIESRRLLCGSAAQFQGDERNVMFLSMVNVSTGAPLPTLRERTAQQRFNVAASRAQDQMWVVFSLDPGTELRADDLRRRLIEHALDPSKLSSAEAVALDQAESPFEAEVIQRLSSAGYFVRSQYPVGAFRIDIVVQGRDKARLAVECDGERYHRIEDLQQDADRQAILERLGWRFCRIRGSSFYRDRDGAMEEVFRKLKATGIEPFDAPADFESEAPNDLVERVRARAALILEGIAGSNVSQVRPSPLPGRL